jgi:hypothetical protein
VPEERQVQGRLLLAPLSPQERDEGYDADRERYPCPGIGKSVLDLTDAVDEAQQDDPEQHYATNVEPSALFARRLDDELDRQK